MTAIRIQVTAEDIAACPLLPDVGGGWRIAREDQRDPVEVAIARVTGQVVTCDEDFDPNDPAAVHTQLATIGNGSSVLVTEIGAETLDWTDRYYRGEAVEPFAFDLEIEDWLVALIARAASIDDLAVAVLNTEVEA